ncbi:MAG: ABC transporter permease [Chloroflexi bacterium]|nr:ABC transporter permease [Chloroflexota bacterium]
MDVAIEGLPGRRSGRLVRTLRLFRVYPVFSVAILSILVFSAITASWIAPFPERYGELRDRHAQPAIFGGEGGHLLGADSVGRDIYTRLLFGARVSLIIAAGTILVAGSFGTALGLISGWYGGWVDEAIMRLVDAMNAIPVILIALVLAVAVGPSFWLLLGILSIGLWPGFARQVRAETLSLKERDYVDLAKVAGAPTPRILYRHILPGLFSTVVVVATNQVGTVILAEAGLSFLGVGVPPPTPSWGGMISDGRLYLTDAWWVAAFPGIAIGLTVTSLVFLGDWLRDHLDPRLRQLE